MARTRIILGYPTASKATAPFLVYCGPSGSAAEAAQRENTTAHRFEIFEGPGRFKNNSRFNPAILASVMPSEPESTEGTEPDAAAEPEAAPEPAKPKRSK